jgi:RNA polymerase sigma factor (sigma-70 family)
LSADPSIRLWKSARDGDRESLELLLRQHQDLVYRFCRARLPSENLAIDATQETAMRMINHIASFRGSGKFSTWVLGIANNVCREFRRQDKKWTQPAEDAVNQLPAYESASPTDPSKDYESENLHHLIESLPDRQRTAIILRYFESLPLKEVAQIMEISVGTVKATLSQATKKLKQKFPKGDFR